MIKREKLKPQEKNILVVHKITRSDENIHSIYINYINNRYAQYNNKKKQKFFGYKYYKVSTKTEYILYIHTK